MGNDWVTLQPWSYVQRSFWWLERPHMWKVCLQVWERSMSRMWKNRRFWKLPIARGCWWWTGRVAVKEINRYREWTRSCLVAWFWYICMLIWDLVKSCLLAKRIGTATFLCIPIVNQFLNIFRYFTITFILRHVHAKIRGKLARAIFESSSSSSKISLNILYFWYYGISFTSPTWAGPGWFIKQLTFSKSTVNISS